MSQYWDILIKDDIYDNGDGTFAWKATALVNATGQRFFLAGKGCTSVHEVYEKIREAVVAAVVEHTDQTIDVVDETRVTRIADDVFGTRNSLN